MKYEGIVGSAPATSPELFKGAILKALADIELRLDALEPKEDKEEDPYGS